MDRDQAFLSAGRWRSACCSENFRLGKLPRCCPELLPIVETWHATSLPEKLLEGLTARRTTPASAPRHSESPSPRLRRTGEYDHACQTPRREPSQRGPHAAGAALSPPRN